MALLLGLLPSLPDPNSFQIHQPGIHFVEASRLRILEEGPWNLCDMKRPAFMSQAGITLYTISYTARIYIDYKYVYLFSLCWPNKAM